MTAFNFAFLLEMIIRRLSGSVVCIFPLFCVCDCLGIGRRVWLELPAAPMDALKENCGIFRPGVFPIIGYCDSVGHADFAITAHERNTSRRAEQLSCRFPNNKQDFLHNPFNSSVSLTESNHRK